MFRPLVPNSLGGGTSPTGPTRPIVKPKKVSAACLACKQRKTKVCCHQALLMPSNYLAQRCRGLTKSLGGQCSGSHPCDQCSQRNSQCAYDLAADQRRKIANQRNIQELVQKGEDIERLCVLVGGILATIRAGNRETIDDLEQTIRNTSGLPELSFYVNGLMATWPEIYLEFQTIDFYLDDAPRRPSVQVIENMGRRTSSAAVESTSEDDITVAEEPDHAAQHWRVQTDAPGAKRSVMEPQLLTPAINTREHTHGAMVDEDADLHVEHTRRRSSDSISDEGSAKSNRPARPWELR